MAEHLRHRAATPAAAPAAPAVAPAALATYLSTNSRTATAVRDEPGPRGVACTARANAEQPINICQRLLK
ncbi:MAG: hypothetical protein EBS84_21575 [Proteobacteria bacterium]|nr:hypothetical protein [Pseudomonadota bacterium]